jgi:predicted amidohydrolase YtcJ
MIKNLSYSLLIIVLCFTSCKNNKVDLIVYNATIYTVDSAFSVKQAMAIKDGKIVATGNSDEIKANYSATENIDAKGQTIFPGFFDAHAHFLRFGESLFTAQLYGINSWDSCVAIVERFAKANPNETWILGRGWDQNLFPGKQYPTNEKLNQLFPNTPILLSRVDGHAAIANNKALELAGVLNGDFKNLVGGKVEVDETGKPTGLLIDNAVDLVNSKLPKPNSEVYEKWLMAAQEKCAQQGLTSITDCGLMHYEVNEIDALQKANKLQMKLHIMLSDAKDNYDIYLKKGIYKTDKLLVNAFKIYADGALGSRGACLLKHYSDKPNWQGFLLSTPKHFDSVANLLVNSPFQMCTHAIGDSANRLVLEIYNKYLSSNNDKRWRIEHAQAVDAIDFNKFGKAKVVPSVQPTHATSDMYWAEERLGKERLKTAYAYKQLLLQNNWLPLGTDFPVEDISPFKTFLAAVIRKDAKGFPANGFQKENALTREEAIRGMTIWAAKAAFLDKETGSLEIGKKADFIVLSNNLMTIDETKILETKTIYTFIDGKKVYEHKN